MLRFGFKRKPQKKIFVIGCNKTGTTSLEQALSSLGFRMGSQKVGESLIEDWAHRKFESLVKFCHTADAFQDVPFSLDYTYQVLDYAFPGSKFILSVRNSSEEWYESLTRFHTKIVGKNRLPTAEDLKQHPFYDEEPGWLWRAQEFMFGIDEHSVYNKEVYIQFYEMHNQRAQHYFKFRPDDLLVLNVADSNAMSRLCQFLGLPVSQQAMPHVNQSA
jgi:hypothetical protein